jgi:CheY-like chemotaxis protein
MSISRPPLHGLTILIVDDHVDTITLFVEYLGLMGAKVIGAGWAEAALMVVETERPHAIITDLHLPGEDGRWLLRQLRARPTPMALIPVYAMSGQRRDRLDATDGFADYFLKPVDLDTVVAALSTLARGGTR